MVDDKPIAHATTQWKNWMVEHALPLWSQAGYDTTRRLYRERLNFDATPIAMPSLRLMVQARQVATFCQAQLDGIFTTASMALECLQTVQARYWQADGQPGWVFSIGLDGKPSSTVRDLYAHAFILFAHASAYQLSADPALLRIARRTVKEVESIFHALHGGFADAVPAPDLIRRQNPHMHLLEAYLALFAVTQDAFYLDRAQALVTLAHKRFINPRSGMLLEFFNSDWTPCKAFGHNPVEPGHLFEWSWLLSTYTRLNPTDPQNTAINTAAERLYQAGLNYGVTHHYVRDCLMDDGTLSHASIRIWPQTELVRLLAYRHTNNNGSEDEIALLYQLSHTFLTSFAPAHLHGGWIDRLGPDGTPTVDHMPASSLYHIYGAVRGLPPPTQNRAREQ